MKGLTFLQDPLTVKLTDTSGASGRVNGSTGYDTGVHRNLVPRCRVPKTLEVVNRMATLATRLLFRAGQEEIYHAVPTIIREATIVFTAPG